MKKSDPRYPEYLIYQREYQRERRQNDLDFRMKRNWAVHKCYHKKKEQNENNQSAF